MFDLAQRFKDTIGIPAALVTDILGRARGLQDQLTKSNQVTPDPKRSEAGALIETVDALLAIGDTAGALAAAQQAGQIDTDLVAGRPGNTDWQHQLSVLVERLGNVQVAQGDLTGALKSYRDSLAIRNRLAESEPGNAGWQRDLAASYVKVGDVRRFQAELAGALKSYRDSLAIFDGLARAASPDDADRQHDLAVAFERIGSVQVTQGDLAGALASYRDNLAIEDRLAKSEPNNTQRSATYKTNRAILPARSSRSGIAWPSWSY